MPPGLEAYALEAYTLEALFYLGTLELLLAELVFHVPSSSWEQNAPTKELYHGRDLAGPPPEVPCQSSVVFGGAVVQHRYCKTCQSEARFVFRVF